MIKESLKDLKIKILTRALKSTIKSINLKDNIITLLSDNYDDEKLDNIFDSEEFKSLNELYKIHFRENISDEQIAIECKLLLNMLNINLDSSQLADLLELYTPQVENALQKYKNK